jgi:hypothetical protein
LATRFYLSICLSPSRRLPATNQLSRIRLAQKQLRHPEQSAEEEYYPLLESLFIHLNNKDD